MGYGYLSGNAAKIIRMNPNPYDNSTIVSGYQKEIKSVNYTVFPGTYHIPAAKPNDIQVVHITPGSWFKELEEGQPWLEIPVSSMDMAKSIINDYAIGLLMGELGIKQPAIFWVPGKLTKEEVKEKHKDKIAEAIAMQKLWYQDLINMTDIMWARTNGSPVVVSDDARMAAETLSLKKAWMENTKAFEMVHCKACGELMNPAFPVCRTCKAVNDPVKAKELGLTFVA
jgi:hypothetical protein